MMVEREDRITDFASHNITYTMHTNSNVHNIHHWRKRCHMNDDTTETLTPNILNCNPHLSFTRIPCLYGCLILRNSQLNSRLYFVDWRHSSTRNEWTNAKNETTTNTQHRNIKCWIDPHQTYTVASTSWQFSAYFAFYFMHDIQFQVYSVNENCCIYI